MCVCVCVCVSTSLHSFHGLYILCWCACVSENICNLCSVYHFPPLLPPPLSAPDSKPSISRTRSLAHTRICVCVCACVSVSVCVTPGGRWQCHGSHEQTLSAESITSNSTCVCARARVCVLYTHTHTHTHTHTPHIRCVSMCVRVCVCASTLLRAHSVKRDLVQYSLTRSRPTLNLTR